MFKIKKGLNLPIAGVPEQHVSSGASVRHVAILGDDYLGMRPSMLVQEGDRVIKGQALFEDKKNPGVLFTAPASGTVVAINRGERRVLQSVVIRIEGDEQREFARYDAGDLATLSREDVQAQLLASGLWTRFVRAHSANHLFLIPPRLPFSLRPSTPTRSAQIRSPLSWRSVKPLMPG